MSARRAVATWLTAAVLGLALAEVLQHQFGLSKWQRFPWLALMTVVIFWLPGRANGGR